MLEPCWKPRRLEIGKKAIWSRFCKAFKMEADLETIWGRFSRRLEQQKRAKVWEGLLEINFQPLQDNIEFGTVLGSILGALGLHFGRILGPKGFQERLGKHDKKEAKTRSTKNVPKLNDVVLDPPPCPIPSRTLP